MSLNDLYTSLDKFDKFNRQMEAMDKWSKMNESIERLTNPLGKQWAAMEKFDRVNRQMEAMDKMNKSIERLIYPMGKHWADMEKFERSQQAWSKSLAALSPTINSTYDYFSKIDKLINPPGFATYEKTLEVERSINRMSSILTATAAIDKHYAFIDKFTRLNDFASGLAVGVVEETISIDNFQSDISGLHAEIAALRNELKNERNAKDLLKLFDRWVSIISIIVGLIGIYFATLGSHPNGGQVSAQDLARSQQETLKALREFIAPATVRRIWVTNRKCRIHSKPSRSSIVVDSISATSAVDIIVLRQKWACVSYYEDDTTVKTGWVDKNYIDTLKGQRREGNKSIFNR